ncbi:hypothetical protein Vi05172_g11685 [Venturia inaequalis]|nr:hypothetical protein Vi05172_g11685 [Venturia inaequalis]
MVHLRNLVTAMAAGTSLVEASASASAQADAKDAIASFQSLLTSLSTNIGSPDQQLSSKDLQTAFGGYMKMLQGVSNINTPPSSPPPNTMIAAINTSAAPFVPNWEGAAIGGLALGVQGLIAGALMGVTTQWTFAGVNGGIKDLTGVDPMELLAGAGYGGGGASVTPAPMNVPLPKAAGGAPAPGAAGGVGAPVVAAPAPQQVSSPGSPAPPALTVPKPPSVPEPPMPAG